MGCQYKSKTKFPSAHKKFINFGSLRPAFYVHFLWTYKILYQDELGA